MEHDPYVDVLPEDMPALPEITDAEAEAMARAQADREWEEREERRYQEDMAALYDKDQEHIDDMAEEADDFSDDDGMSDAEADADTLRMAGMGTDEDYGGDFSDWDSGMIGGDSDLLGEF